MNRSNLKRVVRRLSKLKKEDIKTMYKLYGKTSYYLEYNEESKDNKLKLNKEIITIDLLNPDEKKTSSKNKKSILRVMDFIDMKESSKTKRYTSYSISLNEYCSWILKMIGISNIKEVYDANPTLAYNMFKTALNNIQNDL